MTWRKLISVILVVLVLAIMMVASVAPVLAQENGEEPPEEPPEAPPEEPPIKEEPLVEEEILSSLAVRNLRIVPVYAQPRQAVAINADVVNDGNIPESLTVNLIINGHVEQSTQIGVSPGTAHPVNFTVYRENSGQYSITIGNATGWFNVLSETQRLDGQPAAGDGLGTEGIIAITVIGIMLVAGMIVIFRST